MPQKIKSVGLTQSQFDREMSPFVLDLVSYFTVVKEKAFKMLKENKNIEPSKMVEKIEKDLLGEF